MGSLSLMFLPLTFVAEANMHLYLGRGPVAEVQAHPIPKCLAVFEKKMEGSMLFWEKM